MKEIKVFYKTLFVFILYLFYNSYDISVPLKSGQININQTIPEKGKN